MEFQNNTIFKRVRSFQPTLFFLLHFLQLFSTFCLFACFFSVLVGWETSLPTVFLDLFQAAKRGSEVFGRKLGACASCTITFQLHHDKQRCRGGCGNFCGEQETSPGCRQFIGDLWEEFFWEDAFFYK